MKGYKDIAYLPECLEKITLEVIHFSRHAGIFWTVYDERNRFGGFGPQTKMTTFKNDHYIKCPVLNTNENDHQTIPFRAHRGKVPLVLNIPYLIERKHFQWQ